MSEPNRISRTAAIAGTLILTLALALAAFGPKDLNDLDEELYNELLAQNQGKVVLFNFWATWCAPCRAEMPHLVELQGTLGAKGLRLITISADEIEDRQSAYDFLAEHGVPAPVYIKNVEDDDAFIDAINPKWSGALPALFLYGRDGKLAKMYVGETDIAELKLAINELL